MLTSQDIQNNEQHNNNNITTHNNINTSLLINLSFQQQESLLNIIYTNDLNQFRLLPTHTYDLNFHFPFQHKHFNFDIHITPLILSCFTGKFEIFIQLLNNDFINVNLPSEPDKYSPLMIACYKGFYEIVKILLENNANINQHNKQGYVPFIFIFSRLKQNSYHNENKKICMMLIDLLLSYGADVNTRFDNDKEYTVIMKLVEGDLYRDDKYEMIKEMMVFLIERGADVLIKGKDGKNVIDVIEENENILTKYKGELIRIVNYTKQLYYFNDENYVKGIHKKKELFRNGSIITRYNINEIVFERNDDEGKCCIMF